MRDTRSVLLSLAAAAIAAAALLSTGAALADGAVLAPDGTLFEVVQARYGDVAPLREGSPDAEIPVLALRTTPSRGTSRLELVDGTIDENYETSVSVALEETTGTLFVAYTKSQGLMADMHVGVRRSGVWSTHEILSNRGLYLSYNPKVVVTRQQFVVFDEAGVPVTKSRSIFSLVWWEESGPMQARYAPIFVEDGALRIDSVQPWNLNELAGEAGPTDAHGLPLSAFTFPSVQADPTANGGVLVTFANLATGEQQVLRITFPDDLTKLAPRGATKIPEEVWARAHVPIGRSAGKGRIPESLDTGAEVGATISQKGVTTFHWVEEGAMNFVTSGDAEGATPRRIALRTDLSAEKALRLVTSLAEKN
jgi:hypothetical protein